jgi:ATP-dependent helicase/nuclease subunit B
VNPQDISAQTVTDMAQALAQAMSALDPAGDPPVLVVDSALTAQALKTALAKSSWPGRDRGEPLPWCGTLDQAFESIADQSCVDPAVPRPRPLAMRRVQLAQQLMDYRSIAESLGGSSRAALHLAAKWVEMFDGWEWLESQATQPRLGLTHAPHLADDLALLGALHQANRSDLDRAPWVTRYGRSRATAVWFCINRTPSPKEFAMATRLWRVPAKAIRVWSHPAIDSMQSLRELLQRRAAAAAARPIGRRQLIAAQTTEEAAWSAVQTILDWRAQGIDDIGVVPIDRKMLRRLRALLERAGEPFSDRSGWALDTTVAASAVAGLSDLIAHQANTQSVLEWIHSPFVMRGLALRFDFQHTERQRLDAALRAYGRVAPITLKDLVTQGLLPLQDLQSTLSAVSSRQPIARWSDQLVDAMTMSGLESALAQDAAGQAVLAAIQMLHADASSDQSPITASLWQALLNESLAQSRFVEPVTQACVRMCSMVSLSWQSPKAVVVLGADAQRLPERATPEFFGPKRFAEMGLINPPEQTEAESFGQFASVWSGPMDMAFVACAEKSDSDVEFSSWIELIAIADPGPVVRVAAADMIHSYAISTDSGTTALQQTQTDLAQTASSLDGAIVLPTNTTRFTGRLPSVMSVTDLQKLIDCPYQFYLQTLLGLSPTLALEEESPPSDLGALIHQALSGARMSHASSDEWRAWLTQRIDDLLGRPFFVRRGAALERLSVPPAIAAKLRADAMALVPRLSEWLFARTNNAESELTETLTEKTVERSIDTLGVSIKGRIDRWEKRDANSVLIDFKTSDPDQLKRSVKSGDRDVQLPLYAWLIGPEHVAADAAYVSIKRDGIRDISLTQATGQPMAQLTTSAVTQVSDALGSIIAGDPIELLGMTRDKKICERCSVRGVCRRDDLVALSSEDEGETSE